MTEFAGLAARVCGQPLLNLCSPPSCLFGAPLCPGVVTAGDPADQDEVCFERYGFDCQKKIHLPA
jgi:hypothetical protein